MPFRVPAAPSRAPDRRPARDDFAASIPYLFEDVISNDAEARIGAVLAKQGEPVDSKLLETDFGKLAFQHRHHGLSPFCVEFAR
jgi:hypothetical protein